MKIKNLQLISLLFLFYSIISFSEKVILKSILPVAPNVLEREIEEIVKFKPGLKKIEEIRNVIESKKNKNGEVTYIIKEEDAKFYFIFEEKGKKEIYYSNTTIQLFEEYYELKVKEIKKNGKTTVYLEGKNESKIINNYSIKAEYTLKNDSPKAKDLKPVMIENNGKKIKAYEKEEKEEFFNDFLEDLKNMDYLNFEKYDENNKLVLKYTYKDGEYTIIQDNRKSVLNFDENFTNIY